MSKIRNFINEKVNDIFFYFTSSDTLLVIQYFVGQININTVKFKYLAGRTIILKAPYEIDIDFAMASVVTCASLFYFSQAAPCHSPDPGAAAGDGGEPPRGDGAPGDGLGAGGLDSPGQTRASGLGPGQTEGRLRPQAERLQ